MRRATNGARLRVRGGSKVHVALLGSKETLPCVPLVLVAATSSNDSFEVPV
jgi:hypothetical protein